MSVIVVISLMIAAVVIGWFWLSNVSKHRRHKRKALSLQQFSYLGTEYGLRFSGQDTLQNCIVGLDGIQGTLLIMIHDHNGNIKGEEVIHLEDVKRCDVQKIYIDANDGVKQKAVQKIVLHFERDGRPPVEIPFYHHRHNSLGNAIKMERKAEHWETMLRKMMRPDALARLN